MLFFTTEIAEGSGRNGTGQPTVPPTRNPWPIIRFLAHSLSWASSRLQLPSGEKPKSATLLAKECERNRTDGRFRLALSRNKHRLLPQAFRSYSFNRGAADLDGFAIANERDLSAHGSEWRKRRPIGRIVWTVGRSVRFRSLPLISAPSVVKGTTRDDPTTKNSEKPIYGRGQKAFTHAARLLV